MSFSLTSKKVTSIFKSVYCNEPYVDDEAEYIPIEELFSERWLKTLNRKQRRKITSLVEENNYLKSQLHREQVRYRDAYNMLTKEQRDSLNVSLQYISKDNYVLRAMRNHLGISVGKQITEKLEIPK